MLLLDRCFCAPSDAFCADGTGGITSEVIFLAVEDLRDFPRAVLDNNALAGFGSSGFLGLKVERFELVGVRTGWERRVTERGRLFGM